jgi:hypothetical protein
MTLIFDKNSWHYRLIVYIFTSNFFLETDGIDVEAMQTINMEKDFKIIYKKKPRTVNLCPYCRAVVGAVIMFPFIVLWRLFPHKQKKYTHAEIMKRSQRNTKIARIAVAAFMGIMGVWKLIDGDFFMASFYFGMVIFNLYSVPIFRWIAKNMPKRKFKQKPIKESKPKEPSKIVKSIAEKHDIICPPIFFIEKEDVEKLT